MGNLPLSKLYGIRIHKILCYTTLQRENGRFTWAGYLLFQVGALPVPFNPGEYMLFKRFTRFAFFPLFAVTAGALLLSGCHHRRGWHSSPEDKADWLTKRLGKELDLSPDQKAKLDKIKGEILARKQDFRALHDGIHKEALSQLRAGSVDEAGLNQSLEAREAKAKELRAFLVSEFAQFHALLDAGQREKLASRMESLERRCH